MSKKLKDFKNKINKITLSSTEYCELKNISKRTFYRLTKLKKIEAFTREGYGKTLFVEIDKKSFKEKLILEDF